MVILTVCILFFVQTAPNTHAQISVYRPEIRIIAETGNPNIIQSQVQLTSSSNVTGAIASWSNLVDDVTQRSINASRITVTPKTFDVRQLEEPRLLNIMINASDVEPGIYAGRLLILQGSGAPVDVPITLTLHHSRTLALGTVAAGVISAIILQLISQDTSNVTVKGKAGYIAKLKEAGKQTGGFSYIVATILTIVAVLTAWQVYFPNLASFGRMDWFDYAFAFLSGFGSEAVVNAVINAVKKK